MKKTFKVLLALAISFALLIGIFHKSIFRLIYPIKYSDTVQKVADETGVPSEFLYAIIHTESGFRSDAISPVGARGLMQITEETFEWVKHKKGDSNTVYEDLFNPDINIRYGGWLLSLLFDEFKTQENVLCAYHAGWGTAKKWLADSNISPDGENITNIPYRGTNHYLYKVFRAEDRYKSLYDFV